MQVQDIMTAKPTCCTPDATLQQVARLMMTCDCGEIPVVDAPGSSHLIGVVTDRDIACRSVAQGKNPQKVTARDAMSSPVITIPLDADVDECCFLMEKAQIRRVPVVDANGNCCGIISQADIAHRSPEQKVAEVLRDVSRPRGPHVAPTS